MANSYTQIHIHAVFAVKNRQSLISRQWSKELYKYITGIIQKNNHKLLQINGMPNHIHIFLGMRPTQSISDLMQAVKGDSSAWVNRQGLCRQRFSWQEGYGAFSYAKSQVETVIRYIQNQEEHHKTKTFLEEYREILEEFQIEYDDKYIFKPVT